MKIMVLVDYATLKFIEIEINKNKENKTIVSYKDILDDILPKNTEIDGFVYTKHNLINESMEKYFNAFNFVLRNIPIETIDGNIIPQIITDAILNINKYDGFVFFAGSNQLAYPLKVLQSLKKKTWIVNFQKNIGKLITKQLTEIIELDENAELTEKRFFRKLI